MREQKYHLYLDKTERRLIILCLNELRNKLISEGRYTDCVDELLVKVINTKTVKEKIQRRRLDKMKKTLFEELGGTYEQQGGYLIPCLTLPTEEEKPIGLFGQRHLRYLKEHRKITYINLLTSGRLNSYLADIDERAEKQYKLLTDQMKQTQGITEQLKAENALEWTGRMNNIRACAMEIVNKEIIYA